MERQRDELQRSNWGALELNENTAWAEKLSVTQEQRRGPGAFVFIVM
jgi:hypothetical protein